MRNIRLLSICIVLAVTTSAQIPSGYYNNALGLSGPELKNALHQIIDDHQTFSYDGIKDIMMLSDEDPSNQNNVILLYTGRSQSKQTFGGGANDWNREHVWAKSHGDFGNTQPCGTDVHHIRPTDASVNSSRGNKDFDNGGQQHPEATGCYYDDDSWEPRDEVKGDVARMIFYMDVRYEGGSGEPDLEVVDYVNTSPNPKHGKLSSLYDWHLADPPDAFEINRNNVIHDYQGNRNPFVDHPEFADKIWGPLSASENHGNLLEEITMFPVPVLSHCRITIPAEKIAHVKDVQLYNQVGSSIDCIYRFSGEDVIINTQELNRGLYFIKVSFIDQSVILKMIK